MANKEIIFSLEPDQVESFLDTLDKIKPCLYTSDQIRPLINDNVYITGDTLTLTFNLDNEVAEQWLLMLSLTSSFKYYIRERGKTMRGTLFALSVILGGSLAFATSARADVYITPSGTYLVNTAGGTTTVVQTAKGPEPSTDINPLYFAPQTQGTSQVITPNGGYLIQRDGATTTVIQTSRGK